GVRGRPPSLGGPPGQRECHRPVRPDRACRGPLMAVVSVIVPALDAAPTLAACLDAIRVASAAADAEVLVIDNGARDGTAAVARDRAVRLVSAPDRTVAALRNLGASIARGDILAYVDADCIVAPDWLTVALPHFDDSRVGAVGSPTRIPA